MNFSNNEGNIVSNKNKNNIYNNPFLMKKMFKSNKNNKNKFNVSFKKTKFFNYTNILSNLDIDFEKNSLNNMSNNNTFGNEILIKAIKKNSNKIVLRDIIKDKNLLIENQKLLYNTNYNNYNKNINSKKHLSHKKRINSARPFISDKKLKEIDKKNSLKNENNNDEDIPKIFTFKENIFFHKKNISLSKKNNFFINDIFFNINKINNNPHKNKLNINPKCKSKINQKFRRPKSAIYINNNHNNIKVKTIELNNVFLENQLNNNKDIYKNTDKKLDNEYKNKSYVNNNSNINKDNYQNQKKNIFNHNKENLMITSPSSYLSQSPSEKKLINYDLNIYQQNYSNIDDINMILDSKSKILTKINKGNMFQRRPIPVINKNYLVYLPKGLKKDINNKYNFFSYLLTENMYNNNYEKKNFNKCKNSKKNKKRNLEDQKNNQVKHNLTEYIYNINENQDNVGSYKLDCRKEEEFMTYLKQLNYLEKHPNYNNIYNINDKKIINPKLNRINNIYKPVKIKTHNSTSYEVEKQNKNKLDEKKIDSSEEDSILCDKIKSQPFKGKSKFRK